MTQPCHLQPPRLTDKAYTRRYRVREGHLPHLGFTVSRADVADFMVRKAIDSNSVGKIFGVSN
jgi:NAD(P)H-binding